MPDCPAALDIDSGDFGQPFPCELPAGHEGEHVNTGETVRYIDGNPVSQTYRLTWTEREGV